MAIKLLSRLKTVILDLLFPIECCGCGREGSWLCPGCAKKLQFGTKEDLQIPALDRIFIAGDYDDKLLADLIKKFKYNFIAALGRPLAEFLCRYWSGQLALSEFPAAEAIAANPIVIPIPLSPRRRRWRGFNQAEILANALAAYYHYERSNGLKKNKHGLPQASLDGLARKNNIQGSFNYTGPDLRGRTVIIVDDVATTGATLNEAALIIRQQGAAKIYGLVLAKG